MSIQVTRKKNPKNFKKEADLRENLASFFLKNKFPKTSRSNSSEYTSRYNSALSALCQLEAASMLNSSRPTIYRHGNINAFLSENFKAIKAHLLIKGIKFNSFVTHLPCVIMFEPRLLQLSLMKAVWLLTCDENLNNGRIFVKVTEGKSSLMINIFSKTEDSKLVKHFCFNDFFDNLTNKLTGDKAVNPNSTTLTLLNANATAHKGAFLHTNSHIGFSINKQLKNLDISHNDAGDGFGFYHEDSCTQILSNSLSPLYYVFGV